MAPLIVGQWINMEHYFSAVDPWFWGSGSKVIHNVVSGVGVMLGSQSDLQTGLPLQTVNDGARALSRADAAADGDRGPGGAHLVGHRTKHALLQQPVPQRVAESRRRRSADLQVAPLPRRRHLGTRAAGRRPSTDPNRRGRPPGPASR